MNDSNTLPVGDPVGQEHANPPPVSPPAQQPEAGVADVAAQLRSEYAEIAAVAAQAARLGVRVDAAEALAKGVRPDALRRAVLDELASRSAAAGVVAAQPKPATPGDSPIVRRARERAAASRG